MNELELTGKSRTHIVELEQPRCALHYGGRGRRSSRCGTPARRDGIDLVAASGFRDFDRQLLQLERASGAASGRCLDRAGQPLDAGAAR